MGDEWLWTPKPSFLSAWRALPPKETHQVLEKITLLEQDPMPDGKAKIQVKRKYQGKTVYRIRCGAYRIFYTFRDPYINLLALLRRDEALARERRTIFVGMTRAMRALLVVVPAHTSSPLLTGFDPKYWNLGS